MVYTRISIVGMEKSQLPLLACWLAAQGRWGAFSTVQEVEALMDSLDQRGVRELGLYSALEKRYEAIAVAMRRAAAAEEREAKGECRLSPSVVDT